MSQAIKIERFDSFHSRELYGESKMFSFSSQRKDWLLVLLLFFGLFSLFFSFSSTTKSVFIPVLYFFFLPLFFFFSYSYSTERKTFRVVLRRHVIFLLLLICYFVGYIEKNTAEIWCMHQSTCLQVRYRHSQIHENCHLYIYKLSIYIPGFWKQQFFRIFIDCFKMLVVWNAPKIEYSFPAWHFFDYA